jgi:hypothetical protein
VSPPSPARVEPPRLRTLARLAAVACLALALAALGLAFLS